MVNKKNEIADAAKLALFCQTIIDAGKAENIIQLEVTELSVLADYLNERITGLNILDIGAGNGIIGSYFVSTQNKVTSVDVEDHSNDKRVVFVKVETSKLPFTSDEFDVVISNHVVEHLQDQKLHLSDLKQQLLLHQ